MARPPKDRGNIFRRVDEFLQEQRARKIQETAERSRDVPPPEGMHHEAPAESDDDPKRSAP